MFAVSNWLGQRISRQIGAGFTVIISLIGVVTLAAYWLMTSMYAAGNMARQAEDISRMSLSLEKDFASLERDVFAWQAYPDMRPWENVRDNIGDFEQALASATSAVKASGSTLSLRTLESRFATYKNALTNGDLQQNIDPDRMQRAARALSEVGSDVDTLIEQLRDRAADDYKAAQSQLKATVNFAEWFLILFALFAIVAAFYFSVKIGARITGRVETITNAMRTLASGDKSFTTPYADRADEVGAMAQAVEVFRANAIEAERLAAEHEASEQERRALAKERRHQEALKAQEQTDSLRKQAERNTRFIEISNAFAHAVDEQLTNVELASSEVGQNAMSVEKNAVATSKDINNIAIATDQVTGNVTSVQGALQQMQAVVSSISVDMTQCQSMASEASTRALEAQEHMSGLTERSEKIGTVIDLINAIAAQTNLLALNATIEAARAGEAGKGFAVVAAEVKQLATQTSQATDEIISEIEQLRNVSSNAAESVRMTGSTLENLREIAVSVASAIEEHTAASKEIANNMDDTAHGAAHVTQRIEEMRTNTNINSESAAALMNVAETASVNLMALRTEVDTFLQSLQDLNTSSITDKPKATSTLAANDTASNEQTAA